MDLTAFSPALNYFARIRTADKKIIQLLMVFALAGICAQIYAADTSQSSATATTVNTIGPDLAQVLQESDPDTYIDVIIELSDKLDVKSLKRTGKKHRKELIWKFRKKAKYSQQSIKRYLKKIGIKISKELWLINALAVSLQAKHIHEVAALPDIEIVKLDAKIVANALSTGTPGTAELNIDAVNVRPIWDQGFTGIGTVVGSMDSGVDANHLDLASGYRGGSNSWYDPNGEHPTPYDASGHGTQTTSIMVGGDATGNVIGIAPEAQWIAAKIFNDADVASLSGIHASFQWMLDPDGDPETDDSADVINNSWNIGDTQNTCNTEFQDDITILRAAGIAIVFSAGNAGSSSAPNSFSPANNNDVIAVGALNNTMAIEAYSPRGPSACSGGIFPQLSAPGTGIKAADLTFGFLTTSSMTVTGTSFAAPHVAGAIALLQSALPNITLAELETALQQSAIDAGVAGDDNDYGWGILDVGAAYILLGGTPPTINDFDTDGIEDDLDTCPNGETGWTSNATTDFDSDGCRDTTEDLDDDNDTLLDTFEITNNLDPLDATGVNGASGDADGDGFTNFEEQTAGSDASAATGASSNAGYLNFANATYSFNENAGVASVDVTRTIGSFGAVSVYCFSSDIIGQAVAGVDYTAVGSTLNWLDNDVANKTCSITINDDAEIETDETFQLDLSNPSGGAKLGEL
ncbi:MAG: S8 family serine peptidase [Gammaproteobacteria bacterium]|nr:S8 family serine peptidase [Gammaproteobacteria bacterium]